MAITLVLMMMKQKHQSYILLLIIIFLKIYLGIFCTIFHIILLPMDSLHHYNHILQTEREQVPLIKGTCSLSYYLLASKIKPISALTGTTSTQDGLRKGLIVTL